MTNTLTEYQNSSSEYFNTSEYQGFYCNYEMPVFFLNIRLNTAVSMQRNNYYHNDFLSMIMMQLFMHTHKKHQHLLSTWVK